MRTAQNGSIGSKLVSFKSFAMVVLQSRALCLVLGFIIIFIIFFIKIARKKGKSYTNCAVQPRNMSESHCSLSIQCCDTIANYSNNRIPTLKQACINHIALQLWNSWYLSDALITFVFKKSKKKRSLDEYFSCIEPVLSSVFNDENLPEQIKSKIGLGLLYLEQRMNVWCSEMKDILYNPSYPNIKYCVAKTIITQHGEVDKVRTILRILFDSHLTCGLHNYTVSMYCCIKTQSLKHFVLTEKYIKDKKLIQRVKKEIKVMDTLKNWVTKLKYEPYFIRNLNRDQILIEAAKEAPLDIFDHLLKRLDSETQQTLCSAFLHILSEGKNSGKIIYIMEKLDEDNWNKMLQRHFQKILSVVFSGEDIHHCIKFFDRACVIGIETETIKQVLQQLLAQTCIMVAPCYTEKVLYLRNREMFLSIWYRTPDTIKQQLGGMFQEMLSFVMMKSDFRFLSILVTDTAFNVEQREENIIFILFDLIDKGDADKVELFLKELPQTYNHKYVKKIARKWLKKYIMESSTTLDYNKLTKYTFESEKVAKEFKKELFDDQKFVFSTLASLAEACEETDLMKFLEWGYNNNKHDVSTFLNKLITEGCMIDIYKKYLLELKMHFPRPILLDDLVPIHLHAGVKMKIRKDEELLKKLMSTMTTCKSEITYFMPCLYGFDESIEKAKLVTEMVLSPEGMRHVYDLISMGYEVGNRVVYFRYHLQDTVKEFFKFRKHWLLPYNLCHRLHTVLRLDDVQKYLKRKERPNSELLPHQSNEDAIEIVNANYRLFSMIIFKVQLEKHMLLFKLNKYTSNYYDMMSRMLDEH